VIPPIPSFPGSPTRPCHILLESQHTKYQTITLVANDLKANASCINSELGGGDLGHLALTVPTTVYTTLSNVPFVTPVNPGATAPVLGNNATGAQLAANRDTYAANL
jgi:hypothetical protein